jgi:zinc protease
MMRRCLLCLLAPALLLCFTPAAQSADTPAAPTKVVTVEGITEYRCDNGLRVLLFPDPSSSKVTVNCTVLVGSRHEGYGETGMAHLLEHMVFKGTPTHPNVPKALRDRGAAFNGTTSYDRTNYFETLDGTDDNLEFALRLEADRLVNSYVKRDDLVTEFVVVRNEFERNENNPQTILGQRMWAAAYEWHNYGKETIGNRTDIERVPIDRLQAFYRKYYQPDNAVVVVAGKFNEDKALALIGKYFGTLKKPDRQLAQTYTEEPPQDGEHTVVLRRVGAVAAVGAVYHVPAGPHEDFPALEVLTRTLSAQPSGLLYQGLVTTRKATGAQAFARALHDPGLLEVMVEVEKGVEPQAVRDLMLDLVESKAKDAITDEAVDRAKRQLANQYDRQLKDSNQVGVSLSNWAAMGDWRLIFVNRDRVAKVTTADVKRVAERYLRRNNRTSGIYLPSKEPDITEIPGTPDVTKVVADLKGGKTVVAGEGFDPTIANIAQHLKIKDLPSGLKVALLPHKTRGETVTAVLSLHYGNEESLKGNSNAAQMIGPMLMRGTKKHTFQELQDELARLNAVIQIGGAGGGGRGGGGRGGQGAPARLGTLAVNIECKKQNLPEVLALMGEILREPSFPADDFDLMKRRMRDGIERQRTEPQALAPLTLQRKLSPYPKDDIRYVPTTEESIQRLEAVTLDQVRKVYNTQLGAQHGEFVIVGDFDEGIALKGIQDALKDWKAELPYRRIERTAARDIKGERIQIETPDKKSAYYYAGLVEPVTDSDPDYPALMIADFIFGGGSLSSRLGDRIRQKEGSYGVGSTYQASAFDKAAEFRITASFNPELLAKIDAAMAEELDRMLKGGATDKEVQDAKAAYLLAMKQRRSSDAQVAQLIERELFAGRSIGYVGDLEKKIEALTTEDVNRAFRKHIDPAKLVIVRAGDFKTKGGNEK